MKNVICVRYRKNSFMNLQLENLQMFNEVSFTNFDWQNT